MGGVFGHLAHLYENPNFSFNSLKKILKAAASGELEGTEKTDGYNIYLGYVNGKARAARNKGDMSTGGMDADQLANRTYKGGERVRAVYIKAFDSYERAIDSFSEEEKEKVFGPNGEIFYNAEIQGKIAVKKGDKELFIPITDEIITKVDRENKSIHVRTPEGLVELYLS